MSSKAIQHNHSVAFSVQAQTNDELEDLSLLQLFEQTKRILKSNKEQRSQDFFNGIQEKGCGSGKRMVSIFSMIVLRLRNRKHSSCRDFIGLMSILCNMGGFLNSQKFSLNFDQKFYLSIKKSMLETHNSWKNKPESPKNNTQIQTILFIYANFAKWASQNKNTSSSTQINPHRLLNPTFFKMLFSLDLPPLPSVMKSYRTLIMYFITTNQQNLSNSFLFKSVCSHLLKPQQLETSKPILFYVLSRVRISTQQLKSDDKFVKLFEVLKEEIMRRIEKEDANTSIYFVFLHRYIGFYKKISNQIRVSPEELIKILKKLEEFQRNNNHEKAEQILSFFIKLVTNFSQLDKFLLFKNIVQQATLNNFTFSLQVLLAASKNINAFDIMSIFESGIWAKFLEQVSYHKNSLTLAAVSIITVNLSNLAQSPEIKFIMQAMVQQYLDTENFSFFQERNYHLQ